MLKKHKLRWDTKKGFEWQARQETKQQKGLMKKNLSKFLFWSWFFMTQKQRIARKQNKTNKEAKKKERKKNKEGRKKVRTS